MNNNQGNRAWQQVGPGVEQIATALYTRRAQTIIIIIIISISHFASLAFSCLLHFPQSHHNLTPMAFAHHLLTRPPKISILPSSSSSSSSSSPSIFSLPLSSSSSPLCSKTSKLSIFPGLLKLGHRGNWLISPREITRFWVAFCVCFCYCLWVLVIVSISANEAE